MPHYELYYHLVWSTKNRVAWINDEIEPILLGTIRNKAILLGAQIFAINGCSDHVHLVVSIPPRLSIAKFVGGIKGYSSFYINHHLGGREKFHWQSEYGVFSLDPSSLFPCVEYVDNQKKHHSNRQGDIAKWAFHADEK